MIETIVENFWLGLDLAVLIVSGVLELILLTVLLFGVLTVLASSIIFLDDQAQQAARKSND